ncbi:MAG: phospho-N-acetylmuramoyl-pentapeptide-transferase [Candidatus Eremiobacteraeota bacterium]|nr:phospho-N-acetylmuramoyl-pentapeptide-transferase [Candidatus Eremiobacteraeota bacterium]
MSVSLLGAWAATGFAIAVPAAWLLLVLFRRSGIRQRAYEDAPSTHRSKTGTPTMGGLVFLVVFLAAGAIARFALVPELVFLILVCGGIGAIDDTLGILHGTNRGLRARTKFLGTALVAAIFLRAISAAPGFFPLDTLFHAGTVWLVVPHWLWLLLGILAITGTIHAVNLTDGLDGLATGTILPPLVVLALVAAWLPMPAAAGLAAAGVGACAGFLLFNLHPAKLFMGDTGSLALGALLSGVAILTGEMLLLVLIGGVFVIEALSVMLQVAYFKATGGKRILAMSPLHHHFEVSGWPETRVTLRFWLASLLCSLLGWAIVR